MVKQINKSENYMEYLVEKNIIQPFASHDEFLNREDKSVNGYLIGNTIPSLIDCEGCWECHNCIECVECSDCIDTEFSENCYDCVALVNCYYCDNLKDKINFVKNKHFLLQ